MTPDEALAAIAAHDGLIIVDFDETLYLRNSTEAFIECARPGYVAAVILRLLDFASPWRFVGGAMARDVWRVRVVRLLFPWAMERWRRQCVQQGAALVNQPLLRALAERNFLVASIGFAELITPLLAAMGCGGVKLIACRLQNPSDRTGGKLALIIQAIGETSLKAAMVITDSEADRPVLDACALPCLVAWPAARYERAFRQIYLPGDYLVHVKRPDVPGALRYVMVADLGLWLLIAGRGDALYLLGLGLLFASFWSAYETGYYDNDLCARRFESDPVLSPAFYAFDDKNFMAKAWASAILFGLAGSFAVGPPHFFNNFGKWLILLAALALTFRAYNRIDKTSRIWLYLPLQWFRGLAPTAVIPLGPVGLVAAASQMIARWQEYFLYRALRRHGVSQWPEIPARLIQLGLFLLGLAILVLTPARDAIFTWRALALLAWSLLLARRQFVTAIRDARRLDKS